MPQRLSLSPAPAPSAAGSRAAGPASAPTGSERFHHLDAARALFMLLGIPFHAALAYGGGHWLVTVPQRSAVLAVLPPILSDFRMPGFFLIAGVFAALLLERRPRGAWLASRAERLGVPLLFGLVVIVPLQSVILAHAPPGLIQRPAELGGRIFAHLWFLATLLWLCAGLALIWPVVSALRPRMAGFAPRRGAVLMVAGALIVYELGLRTAESLAGRPFVFVDGLIDFEAVLVHAPMFALGVALRLSPGLWRQFMRFQPAIAAIGLLAVVVHAMVGQQVEARSLVALDLAANTLAAVCVVQSVLALLARYAGRASRLVDRLVDASFTIYLLHHPVVVALAIAFAFVPSPPLVEWVAICAITLAATYGAHRLVRRSGAMLWLLNGVRPHALRRGLLTGARPDDTP